MKTAFGRGFTVTGKVEGAEAVQPLPSVYPTFTFWIPGAVQVMVMVFSEALPPEVIDPPVGTDQA